jgi:hypothetical protein
VSTVDAEPRCELTELLVSACAHCRGHDLADRGDTLPPVQFWTTARYDGGCPACHGRITAGERLARLTDGAWVCQDCGEEPR